MVIATRILQVGEEEEFAVAVVGGLQELGGEGEGGGRVAGEEGDFGLGEGGFYARQIVVETRDGVGTKCDEAHRRIGGHARDCGAEDGVIRREAGDGKRGALRPADPEAERLAGALREIAFERGAVGEHRGRGERGGEDEFGAIIGAELGERGLGGGLGVVEERFAVAQAGHARRVVEDDDERESLFAEGGFPKRTRKAERERDEGEHTQREEDAIDEAVLEDVVFDRAVEEPQRREAALGVALAVDEMDHHRRGDGHQAQQKCAAEEIHRALLMRNLR